MLLLVQNSKVTIEEDRGRSTLATAATITLFLESFKNDRFYCAFSIPAEIVCRDISPQYAIIQGKSAAILTNPHVTGAKHEIQQIPKCNIIMQLPSKRISDKYTSSHVTSDLQ